MAQIGLKIVKNAQILASPFIQHLNRSNILKKVNTATLFP